MTFLYISPCNLHGLCLNCQISTYSSKQLTTDTLKICMLWQKHNDTKKYKVNSKKLSFWDNEIFFFLQKCYKNLLFNARWLLTQNDTLVLHHPASTNRNQLHVWLILKLIFCTSQTNKDTNSKYPQQWPYQNHSSSLKR